MKKFKHLMFAVCVAALTFTTFTGDVHAQDDAPAADDGGDIKVGLILGYMLNAPEHGIDFLNAGVDARIGIDLGGMELLANPVVQVSPTTLGDFLVLDTALNFLVAPDLDLGVDVYVGPGAAFGIQLDPETDVQLGINGIAGAGFDLDAPVEPFVQFRFLRTLGDFGGNVFLAEFGGHFGL